MAIAGETEGGDTAIGGGMIGPMVITIERVPSGYKARADRDTKLRISAVSQDTDNAGTPSPRPSIWLKERQVKLIARAYCSEEFVDERVNWYDTYIREIKQESDGVWTIWIFQEWLD